MSSGLSSGIFRRLGLDVRSTEVLTATSLFVYFFLIGTVQVVGKTLRQATFVDSLGAEKLPIVYLGIALFALPLLRFYEWLTDEMPHYRLMVATNLFCAATLAIFWFVFSMRWMAWLFYIWISLVTVLLMSQFWSYANQVFDARQARRLFGFVGAGGLLGGVVGGLAARVASHYETRLALLVAIVLLVAAAFFAVWMDRRVVVAEGRPVPVARHRRLPTRGAFEIMWRSAPLRVIAALMFLSIMLAQIVDLQFSWAIEEQFQGLDARTAAFGGVFSIMMFAAFFFQLVITARIHRTLGVGFAMRVLPICMTVGSVLLLMSGNPFLPPLMVVLGMRVTEAGLRYSLDQPTREILFVPIPAADRAKAKAFIDVLVQRVGRGAAAVLLLTVTFEWLEPRQASWFTLVLSLCWLACTAAAYRQYLSSLRVGLDRRRFGPGDLELLDPNDVTTLEVLVESLGSVDPVQVLHSVDLLAGHGRGRLVPPLLLYHDDPAVRLRTLQVLVAEERRDALPLMERLLADPDLDVRAEAVRALAVLSGTAGPQMMRERLDDPDFRVRSAAIACLASQGTEEDHRRSEVALQHLLSDADPHARAEGAKALAEIDEPLFQEYLVQLLYDIDVMVLKQTIEAVRRRVVRHGTSPLYVPILISLLRDRRLKHEARAALVASGEPVIPALVHFMNDPNELTWVRRGLPKTIARLGTVAAKRALTESLDASDPFLRGKVIEALSSLGDLDAWGTSEVERQLEAECRLYFVSLVDLLSLSRRDDFRLAGPNVLWNRSPSLLQELLANRMANHLRNIFGLLSLVAPGEGMWGAYERLVGDRQRLRSQALEYLDNIITGAVRRPVLSVIDDIVLEERLRLSRRLFGLEVVAKVTTLRRLVEELPEGDADASWIAAAALQTVWADRVEPLYAMVQEMAAAEDGLVQETALWVAGELETARAEPA